MDLKELNKLYGDDADFQKFLRAVLKKKFEKEIKEATKAIA